MDDFGRWGLALGVAAVLALPGCGLTLTAVGTTLSLIDDDDDDPNIAPNGTVDTPAALAGDVIPIAFRLIDPEGDPVNVSVSYSTDGGTTFAPTPATGATGVLDHSGIGPLASSAAGTSHTFMWNSAVDLLVAGKLENVSNVVVRLQLTQTDGLAGAQLQTQPFDAWNRYSATVAGGESIADDNAIVNPSGMVRTKSGDLIVADSAGHKVVRLDAATGALTRIAGTGTEGFDGDNILATDSRLSSPADVAVDSAGNVFIADRGNSRIRRVDATTGFITTTAGNGAFGYNLFHENADPLAASLSGPEGIDVDLNDNLWIADTGANRVRFVNRSTANITFTYWNGSATVPYTANANAIRTVAGGLLNIGEDVNPMVAAISAPRRVRVIEINNSLEGFVVSDTGFNRVRVVSLRTPVDGSTSTFFGTTVVNGQIRTVAGTLFYLGAPGTVGDGGAATSGKLASPTGLEVLWDLLLFVADTGHNRVRLVTGGQISTFAGSGGFGATGDGGLPQLATLAGPLDVTTDESLNTFIADTFNGRVRMTNTGAWSGLWASGATDFWLAGGAGLATRYDGTTFTPAPVGTPELLLGLHGSGANDVVATGISGGIYRWNGSAWNAETSGVTIPLFGVHAVTSSAQWAVGAFGNILYYNGSSWTGQNSGVTAPAFFDVWGAGTSDVFAVGEQGTVRYFNGLSWAAETGIPSVTLTLEGITGLSTTNVYVVGDVGTFWHKTGSGWTDLTGSNPSSDKLLDVWASDASNIYAVGENGTILHYDGTSTFTQMTSPVTDDLQAVWGTSTSNIYAVGFGDVVIHYNGTSWTPLGAGSFLTYAGTQVVAQTINTIVQPPARQVLGLIEPSNVVTDSNGDLYFSDAAAHRVLRLDVTTREVTVAAGTGRAGFAGDGGSASPANALTASDLRDVWGAAATDVWAVGSNGALVRYNGTAWSAVAGPVTARLNGVHGSAANDVWAVGDGGAIIHFNGAVWNIVPSGTTGDLNAVHAISATDAIAVGDNGAIIRWNGSQWLDQTAAITPAPTTDFFDVWAAAGNDAWIVGQGSANPNESPLWQWNGTAWAKVAPPLTPLIGLNAIHGFAANDIWVAGDLGVIHTYNGTWSNQGSALPNTMRAIFGRSATDLFAAGDAGGFQAGGGTWTTNTVANDTIWESIDLRGGVAFAGSAFVVADDGTIYGQTSVGGAWTLQHGLSQLNGPRGLAFDATGQILYLADTENQRIRAINLGATAVTLYPTGTAIAVPAGGIASVAVGGPLVWPFGLTVDPQTGDCYISDLAAHQIHKIDGTSGAVTTVAGTGVAGLTDGAAIATAQFTNPVGVTFDRINASTWDLYIADTGNHAVRLLSSATGNVTTIAGTGTAGFDADGKSPTTTLFSSPTSVLLAGGDYFVTDTGNGRVRKISGAPAIVSTVAGTGASGFGGDPKPAVNAQLNNPTDLAWDAATDAIYIADANNGRIRRFRR